MTCLYFLFIKGKFFLRKSSFTEANGPSSVSAQADFRRFAPRSRSAPSRVPSFGPPAALANRPDLLVARARFRASMRVVRCVLRVDARAIKPGRTMSVVECRVVDAGADDELVALATANHGVLEPTFDDDLRGMTVGGRRVFTPPTDPDDSLESYLGVDVSADDLRIELSERTRNPWGILHGGLTGLLIEQAAFRAGIAAPTDFVTRYLRAVKEGPGEIRVVETIDRGETRLVRVELVDAGTGRVAVVSTVGGQRA